MKQKKILIVIAVAIIIILIITGIILLVKNSNEDKVFDNSEEAEEVSDSESEDYTLIESQENKEVMRVKDNRIFYTIENCIKKYEAFVNLDYNKQVNDLGYPSLAAEYEIDNENAKKEAILKLLDKDYIKDNGIDGNTLYNYIDESIQETTVEALKINKLENEEGISTEGYSVYAKKTNNGKTENLYYIVKIDTDEEVFCIYPINVNVYNDIDDIKIKNNTEYIEANDRNTFVYASINYGQIAARYFQEYKQLLLNDPEMAYSKLDENYRNKKFGSIDEFYKFIEKNKEDIQLMQIYQYNYDSYTDYNEYLAKDRYENLYMFQENAPKDYVVKLDTYTILTEEFKENYKKSGGEEKVKIQMDVFRQMINSQDFKSAYNVLDENFKQNNFNTQEQFEQFIKENAFKYNKMEFRNVTEEDGVYVCEVTMTDLTNGGYVDETKKDINQYNWNFITKLEDAENFKISFNVSEE